MGSADLSLSCLLDDLLAEQQGDGQDDMSPKLHSELGVISENGHMPDELTSEEEAALLAEQEEQAKQLAELCGEMDQCLASLGDWERRHEAGIELLKRQMEEQYGFSYEEALMSGAVPSSSGMTSSTARLREAEAESDLDSDGPDMCAQLIDEGRRIGGEATEKARSPEHRSSRAPRHGNSPSPASVIARLSLSSAEGASRMPLPPNGSVEQLLEDEERLAKLRQEVEVLRQREMAVARACAGESTPLTEGLIDDMNMDGLSQWCNDVENVLNCGDLDGNHLDGVDLTTLDARLVDAHKHAHIMQHAMDDVKTRLDDELNDLDAMMAECNAIQAKMAVAAAAQ